MLLTLEKVLFLKKVDIFANIDDDALAGLAAEMQEHDYRAGEQIMAEGDMGRELFIIVSGSVRVTRFGETLAVLGTQSVFGELAALDPQPRVATVTAVEDVRVLTLEHTVLLEQLLAQGELARGIIRFLVQRIRDPKK
jgi:CRP-like cAMP-binding protein